MPDQHPIELRVRLELRDYLRANYWYLFRTVPMRVLALIAVLLPAAAVYVLISQPEAVVSFWPFLATMLVLPGILLLLVLSVYIGARRSLASNRSMQEVITYHFSKDGIDAVAASSSGHTAWKNLHRGTETKHDFLLFISRNLMYTIPKRCFEDEQLLAAFRTLLDSELAERACLRYA
jgi:YcxB-like protein